MCEIFGDFFSAITIVRRINVKAAGFEGNQVENLDIAHLAIRDVDEGRDVAAQIEQGVLFDGALVLAKARPGKQCQTKIDSG